MSDKHIYVLYTGGTIGMQKSSQGYIPVSGFMEQQLRKMPDFHRSEMPKFTVHEYPVLVDSANMSPADWQYMADDIGARYDDYDGFLILHGTDTMSYTASALSFMFENLGKPVIVTGSQIPLVEFRSDGQANLLNSLYIAACYPIPEVTVFFNNMLLRGNRSTKAHANGFDAFASPNYPTLLEAGIRISPQSYTHSLTPLESQRSPRSPLKVHRITEQPIAVIMMYPGISPDVIKNTIQQPVKAIVLLSFGVGNVSQNPLLLYWIKEAVLRDVIVVNLTQCLSGSINMGDYATGHALADIGVLSGHDLTIEAALTKLHYLLTQEMSTEEIRRQFLSDLRGEMTRH